MKLLSEKDGEDEVSGRPNRRRPTSTLEYDTALPIQIDDDLPPPVMIVGIDDCLDSPKDRVLIWLTLTLAVANAADAVEVLCIGFIMMELNLSSEYNEFLTASVFTGMLFGGLICGCISDRFGRRSCLLYSLGLNAVAGLLSACAPTVSWLIFFRVVAGIGIGCSIPTAFTLGAELFPTLKRGKLLSVVASFYMVGALFTAFWAWIMLGKDVSDRAIMPQANWRWFAVVSSTPAVWACVMTYRILPESPRFLVLKKRFTEAVIVLNHISKLTTAEDDLRTEVETDAHRCGGIDREYVSTITASPHHSSSGGSRSRSISSSSNSCGSSHGNSSHGPEADDDGGEKKSLFHVSASYYNSPIIRDDKLRRTVTTLLLIWFTLSFGSYGISTWIANLFRDLGEVSPYADSFIFAAANLPGNVISYLLIERVGRRRLLLWGMSLAAICSMSFALDAKQRATVVTCAALFNAMSVVGWNSLDCLSVEYFPTASRTTAMGLLSASGRLGAITAQFVNGSLEGNIPLLLVVTSGCMLVGGLSAWWLPEDPMGQALGGAVGGTGGSPEVATPPETAIPGIEMTPKSHTNHRSHQHGGVADIDESTTPPVEALFTYPRRLDHSTPTLETRI